MKVPPEINLNYVNSLYITQEFSEDGMGKRHKTSDIMSVFLQIIPGTPELYVCRTTVYNDFSYDCISSLRKYYDCEGYEHFLPGYKGFTDEDLAKMRNAGMETSDKDIYGTLQRLDSNWFIKTGKWLLTALIKGYITTGKPSKFDIGPVNTIISANDIEGARFRLGGVSTANLSRRIFARGYVAYGTKDHRFKYGAELEYSFKDKEYYAYEFPIHSLRLKYSYDIDQIGQHYLFTNPDNIFLSLKRMKNRDVTYKKSGTIQYTLERRSGFSLETGLNFEQQYPGKWMPFINGYGHYLNNYKKSSLFIKLRYAPGETFFQSASSRLPINMDAPVFMITHEFGPKGLLGTDFTYNKTEISFQKRFWLSAFGYIDAVIRAAKIWSEVYYPALTWANANLSYTIQPESFALLRPMEFATDQYASWDLTYWMNGLIFNRIPLIKKARLREVVSFRGYYGSLTKKNNPQINKNILQFPEFTQTSTLNNTPYMEMSAGIDNILTILRVDWVWRLTYRNCKSADRYGLRISLHFSF